MSVISEYGVNMGLESDAVCVTIYIVDIVRKGGLTTEPTVLGII